MQKDKNVCVVGGGNWGINHIKTLKMLGVLGGVVESNINVINNLKKEYDNINFFNM